MTLPLSSSLPRLKIGFIGSGQMATALSMGIINSSVLANNSHVIVSDPYETQLDKIQSRFNQMPNDIRKRISFSTTIHNKQCIKDCDVIVLAVKPQIIPYVFKELKLEWNSKSLIISIMAGVTLDTLQNALPAGQRILRIAPNMPALCNAMAAGMIKGRFATDADLNLAMTLLKSMGMLKVVEKESILDILTGLSGSGPAFVFMFIESMADAGVKCGLSRKDSLEYAAQTVFGAAKLYLESNGKHCAQLKDAIASPAGTTIQGIFELEKNGFRYAVMNAVESAVERCRELGKQKSKL